MSFNSGAYQRMSNSLSVYGYWQIIFWFRKWRLKSFSPFLRRTCLLFLFWGSICYYKVYIYDSTLLESTLYIVLWSKKKNSDSVSSATCHERQDPKCHMFTWSKHMPSSMFTWRARKENVTLDFISFCNSLNVLTMCMHFFHQTEKAAYLAAGLTGYFSSSFHTSLYF